MSIPVDIDRFDEFGKNIGEKYLLKCIDSLKNNGFNIVNVINSGESTSFFPAVISGEDTPRFFRDRYGPPLKAILRTEGEPMAITNADIRFAAVTSGAIAISKVAKDSFVFCNRIEERRIGGAASLNKWCIDFVAFDPASIAPVALHPSIRKLQLGCPWWDYVVPIAASFFCKLKRIESPFSFHLAHEIGWDNGDRSGMWEEMRSTLKELALRATTAYGAEFASIMDSKGMRNCGVEGFSRICLEWLQSNRFEGVKLPMEAEGMRDLAWTLLSPEMPSVNPTLGGPMRMALLDKRVRAAEAFQAMGSDISTVSRLTRRTLSRLIRRKFK